MLFDIDYAFEDKARDRLRRFKRNKKNIDNAIRTLTKVSDNEIRELNMPLLDKLKLRNFERRDIIDVLLGYAHHLHDGITTANKMVLDCVAERKKISID